MTYWNELVACARQMLVPFMPKEYIGIVGTAVGITVIVLRFVTTLPLDQK